MSGLTMYGVSMICTDKYYKYLQMPLISDKSEQCFYVWDISVHPQNALVSVHHPLSLSLALKSSLFSKGSHRSFSTLPPTTNVTVTTPISTQEKMKLKPAPLRQMGKWKKSRPKC